MGGQKRKKSRALTYGVESDDWGNIVGNRCSPYESPLYVNRKERFGGHRHWARIVDLRSLPKGANL